MSNHEVSGRPNCHLSLSFPSFLSVLDVVNVIDAVVGYCVAVVVVSVMDYHSFLTINTPLSPFSVKPIVYRRKPPLVAATTTFIHPKGCRVCASSSIQECYCFKFVWCVFVVVVSRGACVSFRLARKPREDHHGCQP